MTIDVRRLHVLREVALRGTIAAAAEALAFTPSAVSQQLSALERETGAELLERSGRGVRLTDAGRVLVEHADAVLHELDRAEAALQASLGEVAGTLRVGAFASVTASVLGPAIAGLAQDFPELCVMVYDVEPAIAVRELRLGELDVVIGHEYDHMLRPREEGVARQPLFSEPVFAVTPHGQFKPGCAVKLSDLSGHCFAAAPPTSDCGMAVREACRAAGFEPDVRFNFSDFPVLLELVQAGLAVSVVPSLALSGTRGDYDVHPISSGGFRRRIFSACRAGSSRRPSVVALLAAVSAAAHANPSLRSAVDFSEIR